MSDQQPKDSQPTENPSTGWSELVNHVALVYAGLIFVGYLDAHTYFMQYGIQVWSYLSTGELLLSFLPLTPTLVFWLAGLLIAAAFLVRDKSASLFKPWDSMLTEEHGGKRWNFMHWVTALMVLAVLMMLGIIVTGRSAGHNTFYITFMFICGLIFYYLFMMSQWYSTKNRIWADATILGWMALGVFYMITLNYTKATHFKQGHPEYFLTLTLSDGVYQSGDTSVYVGRTASTYFFYDRSDSTVTTIPTSEVKGEELKPVHFDE